MKTTEQIKFIELLHQLPVEKQIEFYFMIKGAAEITDKFEK